MGNLSANDYLSFARLTMIHVHRDLNSLPSFNNAVLTIGTFDGVHLGHQQIIALLKQTAAHVQGETVIITFHPHPRKIIANGKQEVKIINTLEEKIELLDKHKIAHLVVVEFTDTFSNQTAEEYIENFLVKKFQPNTIIIGYDHKFGKNRSGDYHLLEKLSRQFGFKVKEIPERLLNEIIISSTRIREALQSGNVTKANSFLGYDYFFSGVVIEGNKIGRTIGFPTANLAVENEEKLIPGNGVYAVTISIENNPKILYGMMNIGVRPTVGGSNRVIEVNIFDFEDNIYGQQIKIAVIEQLRSEIKFEGLDQLKLQLNEDKKQATAIFENKKA